jgi:hypothetical protein
MYYVRPPYELPEPFPEIKTSMYKIRPQVESTHILNGGVEEDESPYDEEGRFRVHERRSTSNQNVPEAMVEEIQVRQEVMIKKLCHLKDMIEVIHSKSRENIGTSDQNQNTNAPPPPPVGVHEVEQIDIVVSADPKRPPYSLLFFYKVLSECYGSIKLQTHVHSSLKEKPEKYTNIFNHLVEKTHPYAREKLCITLIWRRLEHDVELMLDPLNQSPIRGESNIARFFSRLLPTKSPLNYDGLLWTTLVKVDGLLELASERDSLSVAFIERQLLSQNRNGPFLFNEVTIADFVFFSYMAHECSSDPNKFNNSPYILRWLKDCQKFGGFELFLFF